MAGTTKTKPTETAAAAPAKASWQSRAVQRVVQPGSWVECTSCHEQVKFKVRAQNMQVICNVYDEGVWTRVEHYHADCYDEAGQPYGTPED